MLTIISCGLLLLLAWGRVVAAAAAASDSPATQNANHIFNAVHSSMRQWGSSLHHNGMSVFVATVPEGTQLYHGTNQSERVNATEWLAFEPEHALVFARSRRPGPPPRQVSSQQIPLQYEAEKGDAPGYLHTYRVKHQLRLLYIDGQSAAKSTKGTLDLQDFVLLHNAQPDTARPPPTRGIMNEVFRADHLCAMARTDWAGKIDGFLRMELGFEIILCSFEDGLEVERITQAKPTNSPLGPGGLSINYYRAVASRFDGIGGDRVRLNHDHFVTLYTFDNAVSFTDDGLPRASNDTKVITPILEAITNLALSDSAAEEQVSPDWQAVADMVVTRYSDRIDYLTSGAFIPNEAHLYDEIEWALRPYIDYSHRNKSLEIQRCATQFFPFFPPPTANTNNHNHHNTTITTTTAPRAILHVTSHLCTAFFDAADQASTEAISTLRALKIWLNWTTFKRCRTCAAHEVCFVPIWPAGGQEDFDHPKCISTLDETGQGYWGDWWSRSLSSSPSTETETEEDG